VSNGGVPVQLSTRLMAAMVALVALTAASIGLLTYRSIEAVALPRALSAIEFHARLLALELEASVRADASADLRAAFSHIRSAATELDGHVFLANEHGHYLLHPDPAKEFSVLSANPPRLHDEFPELALALAQEQPLSRIVNDRAGERFGAAVAPVRLAEGARLALIEIVPYASILAGTAAARQSILLASALAILAAIALAAMMTRSLTGPLGEMIRAVEALGSDKPILVPTNATGEIGVLAKTFEQRAAEIREKTAALTREVQQRQRAERQKAEYLATVSHELRTPLTSIAGSLSLLSGGAVGQLPDQAKRLLTVAHANSRRLVRLINDILDVEKLESGAVEFDLQRVAVKPLIDQAIEAIGAFTDSFNVHVLVEDGAADAAVCADPDRLTQVMVNLLSNAVKYSPTNAQVLVAIVVHNDRVRIAVRDHGPGIPEAFKGRMFERFAQADGANARRRGGTGLGLSIVKQIVTRLGGDVGFEPAPGGGTIFHVDLPLWNEKAMVDPAAEPRPLRASA
jgi:signal transduction histidine kinase